MKRDGEVIGVVNPTPGTVRMTALCRERLEFTAKVASEFEKTEALYDAPLLDESSHGREQHRPVAAGRAQCPARPARGDPERLRALPENVRAEWQANGWLAALEAHVASAQNWARLLAYEDEMSATLTRP